MMTSTSEKKLSAKERILEAAALVFAEEGIKGATTREIVRVAGVNECTLFRNFQNKEELLRAVIEKTVNEMTSVLSAIEINPNNLREDLLFYAKAANQHMEKNEGMIRTVLGEMGRQPEHALRVVEHTKQPLVDKLKTYFKDKQEKGLVRQNLELTVMVDVFGNMLLAGVLKRPVTQEKYCTELYLETCVDIFLRGISTGNSP